MGNQLSHEPQKYMHCLITTILIVAKKIDDCISGEFQFHKIPFGHSFNDFETTMFMKLGNVSYWH